MSCLIPTMPSPPQIQEGGGGGAEAVRGTYKTKGGKTVLVKIKKKVKIKKRGPAATEVSHDRTRTTTSC